MAKYTKEDINKFSDVEQEIITLLELDLHRLRVKKEAMYTDAEIASGKVYIQKGYMEVEWSLSRIIEVNYAGYGITAMSRGIIRNMIRALLRVSYLAPMGTKLPADIINNIIPKMGVYTESLRDSQSYIYLEELKKHKESLAPKRTQTHSEDIDNVMRIIQPEIYYDEEVKGLKTKASMSVQRDGIKRKRLEKDYVLKVKRIMKDRTHNGKFTEFTSKFNDGLSDEEEFIIHFNLETNTLDINYEELLEKRELLKFLTLKEIGNMMRNKEDQTLNIEDPSILRVNAKKRRLEYKDELFGWYPITNEDIIQQVLTKYDIDISLLSNVEVS